MEKYLEQMRQSLALSETALEGLEHISKQCHAGHFAQTVVLFHDVVHAVAVIEQSLLHISKEAASDELVEQTSRLRLALELAVSAYEDNNEARLKEVLQFTLLPRYKSWKRQLEQAFHPYIVS